MGCLSLIVVIIAILAQVIAGALALIVLGSAGGLGSAVRINSDDALIVFFAIVASLVATVVLALKIWLSSRDHKRMRASNIMTIPIP